MYVDGKKVYDRKEEGAVDFLPALREIHKIRDSIAQTFAVEFKIELNHSACLSDMPFEHHSFRGWCQAWFLVFP